MAHSPSGLQVPQFLAEFQQEAFVPYYVGLSLELLGCTYNIVASFSQSKCSKRENQEGAHAC